MRGRRLQGKEVNLPTGYVGIITQDGGVSRMDRRDVMYNNEEAEEEQEEIHILNEVGSFEKIVLWDHEKIIEDEDAFVKGVSEWIGFAEMVGPPQWSVNGH